MRKGQNTFLKAKRRRNLLLSVLILLAVWNWSYIYVISPAYRYAGLTYNPPAPFYLMLAWVMALMPALWMPLELQRPSQMPYWLLYMLVIVPVCFIPFYTLHTSPESIALMVFLVVASFGLLGCTYRLSLIKMPRSSLSGVSFWLLLMIFSLLLYGYIVSVFGLQFTNLSSSLLDVYDTRAEYKAEAQGGFSLYAVSWLSKIINPFLIAYALVYRVPLLLLIGFTGQFFLFSITGLKGTLLSSVFVIIALIPLKFRERFSSIMTAGTVTLLLSCGLIDVLRGTYPVMSGILIRRILIIPGYLTGCYYEFFAENPKVFLSHSIFRGFFEYPYSQSPALLIGTAYSYREGVAGNANANIWADAFANFGFPGFFLWTLVLGLLFWIYDSIAYNRDYKLATMILLIPSMTFSNSALLTSLFTHGILLAICILYFMPAERPNNILSSARNQRYTIDKSPDGSNR